MFKGPRVPEERITLLGRAENIFLNDVEGSKHLNFRIFCLFSLTIDTEYC
jgi:hypothetical protein